LGGGHGDILHALGQWVEAEHQDKRSCAPPDDMLATTWPHVVNPRGTPRQLNGWDCGVFTLMAAAYLSVDRPFDYSQGDVHRFFRAMCALRCIRQSVEPGPAL